MRQPSLENIKYQITPPPHFETIRTINNESILRGLTCTKCISMTLIISINMHFHMFCTKIHKIVIFKVNVDYHIQ